MKESKHCDSAEPIARLANGNVICASQEQGLIAAINSGKLQPATVPTPSGWEYWGEYKGQGYDIRSKFGTVTHAMGTPLRVLGRATGLTTDDIMKKFRAYGGEFLKVSAPILVEIASAAAEGGVLAAATMAEARFPGSGAGQAVKASLGAVTDAGAQTARHMVGPGGETTQVFSKAMGESIRTSDRFTKAEVDFIETEFANWQRLQTQLFDKGARATEIEERRQEFLASLKKKQEALDAQRGAEKAGASESPFGYTDAMFMYEGAGLELASGQRELRSGAGKVGGAECPCTAGWIGADELNTKTVRQYADSVNTRTKEDIIDRIIDAVGKLGLAPAGETKAEKIRNIVSKIPRGNQWKNSDESHKRICTSIATALNDAYGNKVIDTKLPPELVCRQVAEIVASLAAGMHSEFLAVYNDVRKVLGNLTVLRDSLVDTFNQIKGKMAESTDATIAVHTTQLSDLHKIILDEIDRQIKLLRNLLNVTLLPTQRDLAALIGKQHGLGFYIDRIKIEPGTAGFGKVITDILNGLGLTANYAMLIDRALKTVGITISDFVKQNNLSDLREIVAQNFMGRKDMTEEQISEYLRAAKLLAKNFYRKDEIGEIFERGNVSGSNEMDEDNIAWDGSAEDDFAREGGDGSYEGGDSKYHTTVMDRRVKDRRRLKNLIFTAFYNRVNDIYENIIAAMETLSAKIGTEVPLSDQLDGFRHIIQRINDDLVRKKDIYYALIGYYNDALSRSKKDALLGNLKMVSSYIDSIVEMSMYQSTAHYFRDIQKQINVLIETIDKYSDEIAGKFGSAEDPAPAEYEGGDDYDGGADDEYEGGAEGGNDWSQGIKQINRSTRTINDAFRKFDYYYRVAQIKSNLRHSSRELDEYSAKYEKIIASSIADVLAWHKTTYDRARKELDTNTPTDQIFLANTDIPTEDDAKKERDAARKFLDQQWDARKKFWAAIEAVDSYMRHFTNGLVKNPDDIRDIKSMLDEIEVINDWYNDQSGNEVAAVFDYFPAFFRGDAHTVDGVPSAAQVKYPHASYADTTDKHYYKKISEHVKGVADVAEKKWSGAPGNPLLVTTPQRGLEARTRIATTMRGLGVLKNLISVFVHIGSKFGGQELRKKVFLTPVQIYNNIVEYLQASAFSQGFGVAAFPGFAGAATMEVDPNYSMKEFYLNKDGNIPGSFGNTGQQTASLNLNTNVVTRMAASQANVGDRVTYGPAAGEVQFGVTSGVIAPAAAVGNAVNYRSFKKRWGVWMRSVIPGVKAFEGFGFKKEDEYFVLMLKSLAAKIFTVTGMYDVIDRPLESNALSPVRMIVGGAAASEEIPKVIEPATELYLRLPLLAQFYRNIFGFDEGENSYDINDKNKFDTYGFFSGRRRDTLFKISMVPDVDGAFSGLIRFIFRKAKFVQNNTYTLDDVKEIVREVNLIYQRMSPKYGEAVVMETIHEFVAEINRRYGIVGKSERDQYEAEFGYRYDYSSELSTAERDFDRYSEPPAVDIAILPGETEEQPVRLSSAEKLLSLDFESEKRDSLFTVHADHKRLVYNFRCAIDRHFEKPNEEYSFKNAIKMCQVKLSREQNDAKRLDLVAALVRGVDIQTKTDGLKYVMFHETVVAGLNTLSAIHTLLQRFKRRVLFTDLRRLEDEVWKYLSSGDTVAGHVPKTLDNLRIHLRNYFTGLNLGDTDDTAHAYAHLVTGRDRAMPYNGGNSANVDMLKHIDGIPAGNNYAIWTEDTGAVVNFGIQRATGGVGTTPSLRQYDGHDVFVVNNINTDQAAPYAVTVQAGMVSILAGQRADELKKAHRSNRATDLRRRAETFFRFLFDREYVMKELVETVFGISSDLQGMVDVKIENGKLFMSFGGLHNLIDDMFLNISNFLDILRPHISPEILNRYTAKTIPGSFYWLQEQLIEKIKMGRPAQNPSVVSGTAVPKAGYTNLEELAARLNSTYQMLTREYDSDGSRLSHNRNASQPASVARNRTRYDKVFAEMIFYDAAKPGSGIAFARGRGLNNVQANSELHGGLQAIDFKGIKNPFEQLHFSGPPTARVIDTRYIARFKQLYSWDKELTPNRSALFAFNQLIAKFIANFFDPSVLKMYGGLVQPLAAGSFNRSIMDLAATYPDTHPAFFFPAGAAQSMKYSNLTLLDNFVSNKENRDTLKDLITLYLQHGVFYNGAVQPLPERRVLLDPSVPHVRLTRNFAPPGGPAIVGSNLNAWIVLYMVAKIIEHAVHLIDHIMPAGAGVYATVNVAAGATDPAPAPVLGVVQPPDLHQAVFNLINLPHVIERGAPPAVPAAPRVPGAAAGGAAPATLDAAINAYVGVVPGSRVLTFDQIINTLLGTTVGSSAARAGMIYVNTIRHGHPAAVALAGKVELIAGSPFLGVIGELNNAVYQVAAAGQTDNATMIARFEQVLNRIVFNDADTANPQNSHNVLLRAASANIPFRDDMFGDNNANPDPIRVKAYADLAAAIGEAAMNNYTVPAAYITTFRRIVDVFNRVPEVLIDAPKDDPKILVEAKDVMGVDTDAMHADVPRPQFGDGRLRLVSHDADTPFIGADPWTKLGETGAAVPGDVNVTMARARILNFGKRWDPDADHVLFTSLAVILRNILTSRSAQNATSVHLIDNVADLNMYMKEKMRANLPGFKALFQELNNRCTLLKLFISRPELDLTRSFGMAAGGVAAISVNPWPFRLVEPAPGGTMSSRDAKTRFTGILDSIQRGTMSLIQACEQTLREIGDEPKYLELSHGGFKDFKQQNGFDPFTPLSSTLAILRNTRGDENKHTLLPFNTLGDPEFKFTYGTRLLLGQPKVEIQPEHLPGWTNFVNSYNMMVDGKNQIDLAKANSFAAVFARAARFIYGAKFIKGSLTSYLYNGMFDNVPSESFINFRHASTDNDFAMIAVNGMFTRGNFVVDEKLYWSHDTLRGAGDLVTTNGAAYTDTGVPAISNASDMSIISDQHVANWRSGKNERGGIPRTPMPVYSIANELVETLQLTESSFRDDKYKAIVSHIIGREQDAGSLEIQNIFDLNIVPINIHALMREVPLANLYNYAYSFDRMIIELYYGLGNVNARKLISELCGDGEGAIGKITSAKDMLVQLLIKPYADVTKQVADGDRTAAFAGVNMYEKFVKPMMVGATGGDLGRPKFLSDQLFNKSLFGELYSGETEYREVGPPGAVRNVNVSLRDVAGTLAAMFTTILTDMRAANARWGNFVPAGAAAAVAGLAFDAANVDHRRLVNAVAEYMAQKPKTGYAELEAVIAANPLHHAAVGAGSVRYLLVAIAVLVSGHVADMYSAIARNIRSQVTVDMLRPYFDRIALSLFGLSYLGARNGDVAGLPQGAGGANPDTKQRAVNMLMHAINTAAGAIGGVNVNAVNYPTGIAGLAAANAWAGANTPAAGYAMSADTMREVAASYRRLVNSGERFVGTIVNAGTTLVGNDLPGYDMGNVIGAINSFTNKFIVGADHVNLPASAAGPQTLHWIDRAEETNWDEESEPGANVEPDNENVFNPAQIQSADVSDVSDILGIVGRLRFDTVFIRNLIFIVNLYRSVRLKLSKDLTYNRDVVLKSAAITRAGNTEFRGNSTNGPSPSYTRDPRFLRYQY